PAGARSPPFRPPRRKRGAWGVVRETGRLAFFAAAAAAAAARGLREEVGQFAERGHTAAGFRRVSLRVADGLVGLRGPRREADLFGVGFDAQDAELHLLPDLRPLFGTLDP